MRRVAICVERSLEMVVGTARHPEGGWVLCTAGCGLSGRAAWLHAEGCRSCDPGADACRGAREPPGPGSGAPAEDVQAITGSPKLQNKKGPGNHTLATSSDQASDTEDQGDQARTSAPLPMPVLDLEAGCRRLGDPACHQSRSHSHRPYPPASRLHHLHLGLYRTAKRRDGGTWGRGELPGVGMSKL